MLDVDDVAGYLLERRLLGPRAVVDGGLRVVDASRLNRVFRVTAEGERCFVLKAGETAAHEAAVLERLRALDRDLASCLPSVVVHDAAEGVIVFDAEPAARDLAQHHRGGRFSATLARRAGMALGRLHRHAPDVLGGVVPSTAADPRSALDRPDLATLDATSETAQELIRILQRSHELGARLDELYADRRVEAVIHGDVRWDNCLAVPGLAPRRWARLLLIDWELAGPGDPGEDVGAFLGEYLRAWLWSIPDLNPHERLAVPARARYPLGRMAPALRAFWDGYARHGTRSAAELSATLRRATRFAAVRLLMAALEEAQALADLRATTLNAVHLSHAVLRRPDEAAAHLLGIGAP